MDSGSITQNSIFFQGIKLRFLEFFFRLGTQISIISPNSKDVIQDNSIDMFSEAVERIYETVIPSIYSLLI